MSDEQGGTGGGAGIAAGGFGVVGIGLIVMRLVLLAARIGAHETSSYEPPSYTYTPPSYSGGTASDDFSKHSFFVKAADGVHTTTDMPSSWAKAESVKMHVVVDESGEVSDATCDGCDALLRLSMYDVKFAGGAGEFDVELTKAF